MQKNHGGVADIDPAKPESLLDAADHLVVIIATLPGICCPRSSRKGAV
jgi:hypothetical protein